MEEYIIWIIIGITALVIDIITSSFFFVGFTIASVFAMVAQYMGFTDKVQWIVFILSSAICIPMFYRYARDVLKKSVKKIPTSEEKMIGKVIALGEDVKETATIKIDGIYWTVKNIDKPLHKGEKIIITDIDGSKFIIKKYEEKVKEEE